jgi:hypothetical protein
MVARGLPLRNRLGARIARAPSASEVAAANHRGGPERPSDAEMLAPGRRWRHIGSASSSVMPTILERRPCWSFTLIALAALAFTAGCEQPTESDREQPSEPDPERQLGRLTLTLHDAPADEIEAFVIEPITLGFRNADTGVWTEVETDVGPIDLLELTDGVTLDLLVDAPIMAAPYDELRLILAHEPRVLVAGEWSSVAAPSATSSGIKIKGSFSVSVGGCTSIRVDFDVAKSLDSAPGGFRLKPVVDIVDWSDACGPAEEQPESSCKWEADDCDVCVPNVVAAFERNRTHGWPLRLDRGNSYPLSEENHYQGCARIENTLICSRSGAGISLEIFDLESRTQIDEPFYSNVLGPEQLGFTPAPDGDGLIDGGLLSYDPGDPDPDSGHSGGMDVEGCFVAVPMESEQFSTVAIYNACDDPKHPTRVGLPIEHQVGGGELSNEAGTASLARLPDGKYLLIIGRADVRELDFYVSPSLVEPNFEFRSTWYAENIISGLEDGDANFEEYQSLSAVMQCDGTLFLIGMHNNALFNKVLGEDWADLYRVDFDAGEPVIHKVAKKHFWCGWTGGIRQCNFDAAGAVWISRDLDIVLYSTEHAVNGYDWSVKLMEFAPDVPVSKQGCPTTESSWVEFFDDSGFSDRSLHISWPERELEPLANLDQAEDFEDRISSLRFCGAPGVRVRFYQHKEPCAGEVFEVEGNGQVQEFPNLHDLGFGDAASCVEFTAD